MSQIWKQQFRWLWSDVRNFGHLMYRAQNDTWQNLGVEWFRLPSHQALQQKSKPHQQQRLWPCSGTYHELAEECFWICFYREPFKLFQQCGVSADFKRDLDTSCKYVKSHNSSWVENVTIIDISVSRLCRSARLRCWTSHSANKLRSVLLHVENCHRKSADKCSLTNHRKNVKFHKDGQEHYRYLQSCCIKFSRKSILVQTVKKYIQSGSVQ